MHELASKAKFVVGVQGIKGRILKIRGWHLYSAEYPILDVGFIYEGHVDLRIRLLCDDWDDVPPSIQLLNVDGKLLEDTRKYSGGIFNHSQHPSTGMPFICTIGSREYHTHPSHIGDDWGNYKGKPGYDLGGMLTKVWRGWEKVTK